MINNNSIPDGDMLFALSEKLLKVDFQNEKLYSRDVTVGKVKTTTVGIIKDDLHKLKFTITLSDVHYTDRVTTSINIKEVSLSLGVPLRQKTYHSLDDLPWEIDQDLISETMIDDPNLLKSGNYQLEAFYLDFRAYKTKEWWYADMADIDFHEDAHNVPSNVQGIMKTNLWLGLITKFEEDYDISVSNTIAIVPILKGVDEKAAAFEPTTITAVPFYSEDAKNRSLNFIMKSNSNTPGNLSEATLLPKGLLAQLDVGTTLSDGAFAVANDLFWEKVLSPLVDEVGASLFPGYVKSEKERGKHDFFYNSSRFYLDESTWIDGEGTKVNATAWLDVFTYTEQFKDQGSQLSIFLKINIHMGIGHLDGGQDIDYGESYSTQGTYTDDDHPKKGLRGLIKLVLRPGVAGKITIEFDKQSYVAPVLGLVGEPYKKRTFWKLLGLINPVGYIVGAALDGDFSSDPNFDSLANSISDGINKFKKDHQKTLQSFSSNKVILPFGEVYAYKDAQKLNKTFYQHKTTLEYIFNDTQDNDPNFSQDQANAEANKQAITDDNLFAFELTFSPTLG